MSEFAGTVEQNDESSISLKAPDNAFLLNDSSCGEVVERADNRHENQNEVFVCRVYEKTEPLFSSPCDSCLIGIHKASKYTMDNHEGSFPTKSSEKSNES